MLSLMIATFCILLSLILFSPKRAILRFLETGSLSKSEEAECMWFAIA
ncbi:TPA: hypothetical protein IUU99_002268 [Enterococcus faecalis]|nr:hypothetical protein [Enterococcus faecalis]